MAERSKAPDSSLISLILCVLVSVYWRGFKSHCRQFFPTWENECANVYALNETINEGRSWLYCLWQSLWETEMILFVRKSIISAPSRITSLMHRIGGKSHLYLADNPIIIFNSGTRLFSSLPYRKVCSGNAELADWTYTERRTFPTWSLMR